MQRCLACNYFYWAPPWRSCVHPVSRITQNFYETWWRSWSGTTDQTLGSICISFFNNSLTLRSGKNRLKVEGLHATQTACTMHVNKLPRLDTWKQTAITHSNVVTEFCTSLRLMWIWFLIMISPHYFKYTSRLAADKDWLLCVLSVCVTIGRVSVRQNRLMGRGREDAHFASVTSKIRVINIQKTSQGFGNKRFIPVVTGAIWKSASVNDTFPNTGWCRFESKRFSGFVSILQTINDQSEGFSSRS